MDIVPITVYREARGEGEVGMRAVAWVIANRARSGGKLWPTDPERVCLQPFQFSCWNAGDSQRKVYPDLADPLYVTAYSVWEEALHQSGEDPTHGATYYCNPQVCQNPFDNKWYVETAHIGHHVFYRSV